ncbi:hypothetical protein FBU31_001186 [Coemansia sp. 'formosensis']|nr:hypothetical protein FBU31_001186 [Coemansia sp. 'formosensis']
MLRAKIESFLRVQKDFNEMFGESGPVRQCFRDILHNERLVIERLQALEQRVQTIEQSRERHDPSEHASRQAPPQVKAVKKGADVPVPTPTIKRARERPSDDVTPRPQKKRPSDDAAPRPQKKQALGDGRVE